MPPVERKYLAKKKLKPGQGWLQWVDPKRLVNARSPHFRGALVMDRDVKKGRRLYLTGWLYKDKNGNQGTVIYFIIASAEERHKQWVAWRKKERERIKEATRNLDMRLAREKAAPKVLKREDVV